MADKITAKGKKTNLYFRIFSRKVSGTRVGILYTSSTSQKYKPAGSEIEHRHFISQLYQASCAIHIQSPHLL